MTVKEFFQGSRECRHFTVPGANDCHKNHLIFWDAGRRVVFTRGMNKFQIGLNVPKAVFQQFLNFEITLTEMMLRAKVHTTLDNFKDHENMNEIIKTFLKPAL